MGGRSSGGNGGGNGGGGGGGHGSPCGPGAGGGAGGGGAHGSVSGGNSGGGGHLGGHHGGNTGGVEGGGHQGHPHHTQPVNYSVSDQAAAAAYGAYGTAVATAKATVTDNNGKISVSVSASAAVSEAGAPQGGGTPGHFDRKVIDAALEEKGLVKKDHGMWELKEHGREKFFKKEGEHLDKSGHMRIDLVRCNHDGTPIKKGEHHHGKSEKYEHEQHMSELSKQAHKHPHIIYYKEEECRTPGQYMPPKSVGRDGGHQH